MTSTSNMLGITELHYSHIQMFSWDYLCVKSCTLRAGGCQGSPRGALMPVSNPIDKLLSFRHPDNSCESRNNVQHDLVRVGEVWKSAKHIVSSRKLIFSNIDCLEVSNLVCCLFHIVITPPPPSTKTAFWPPFWPNLSKYVLECCRPALWE